MTVEERSGPLGQPYSRDELWAESHHVGLALENGPIDRLRRDIDRVAVEIGPRNIYHYEALQKPHMCATASQSPIAAPGARLELRCSGKLPGTTSWAGRPPQAKSSTPLPPPQRIV